MSGPELKGKITLDETQASAALARVGKIGAAAAAQLESKMGGALKSFAAPIAALGPAIAGAFAGKAIYSGVAKVFEAGRAMQVLSRQTGAGVAGLSILQAKFKAAGLDGDLVASSIFRLQKSLNGVEDEENKGGSGRLAQLGLDLKALKSLSPDQQLLAVGKAISAISDPAERTGAAMQIFGRSGAQLNAVFNADFAKVSPALQAKADLLQKNAALFEDVSKKLERAGGVFKTFYVGAAAPLANALLPVLDRLEKLNLVQAGQAFGNMVLDATRFMVGAFELPESAFTALKNGLAAAFLSGGNVLLATFQVAARFFQDGLLASFQGIGSALTATLMGSLDRPIRYLQAAVEAVLERTQANRAAQDGKHLDLEGFGLMSAEGVQRRIDQLNRQIGGGKLSKEQRAYFLRQRDRAAEYQRDPGNFVPVPRSVDEIMEANRDQATRLGVYGGGQTAAEWRQQARESLSAAMQGALASARSFQVRDELGAGAYADVAARAFARTRQTGAGLLGAGMVPLPAAVLPGPLPAGATAPHPFQQFARIGLGMGPLGFDPSARAGWTGAINVGGASGLSTGNLRGGSYGASMPAGIWNQVSGRVGGTNRNPVDLLGQIKTGIDQVNKNLTGPGNTSVNGAGSTVTGK